MGHESWDCLQVLTCWRMPSKLLVSDTSNWLSRSLPGHSR